MHFLHREDSPSTWSEIQRIPGIHLNAKMLRRGGKIGRMAAAMPLRVDTSTPNNAGIGGIEHEATDHSLFGHPFHGVFHGCSLESPAAGRKSARNRIAKCQKRSFSGRTPRSAADWSPSRPCSKCPVSPAKGEQAPFSTETSGTDRTGPRF